MREVSQHVLANVTTIVLLAPRLGLGRHVGFQSHVSEPHGFSPIWTSLAESLSLIFLQVKSFQTASQLLQVLGVGRGLP